MPPGKTIGGATAAKYRSLLSLVVSLSIGAFWLTDLSLQGQAKNNLAALQGFWVLKTTEWCGLKTDLDPTEDWTDRRRVIEQRNPPELWELPSIVREERTTLKINGNAFTGWDGAAASGNVGCIRRTESTEGTITLDTNHNPPILTRRLLEPAIREGDQNVYASCWIEGNTLRLGIELSNNPKKLPATFVTDRDENIVVPTFKREKE
jgi:hypothetical protein